ncbi:MAG TPA: prepilin-type N-terminal cleavage/methylation domain-containing protein [Candidatus Binatia bacterium]
MTIERPHSRFSVPVSRPEAGFTLVEVTISMALLALIVIMLYGSFFLAEKAVAKAQVRSDESQSLRTFEEFVGGYIRSAYPYRASTRDASVYFFGDDRSVEFVSSLSTSLGGRGMSKIRISSDLAGSRGATLTLEEEMPVRVGDKGGGGGYRNSLVLAEGLRGFRIEYLDPGTDAQAQTAEVNWVDAWDGKQKRALPRAIRLIYRGDRGEEIRWTFPIMIRVLAAL